MPTGVCNVPSPVARSSLLGQSDGRVDEGERIRHTGAHIVEVSADEEMVVAGLHGRVSNELELEGELVSRINLDVVAQTSQLQERRRFEEQSESSAKKNDKKMVSDIQVRVESLKRFIIDLNQTKVVFPKSLGKEMRRWEARRGVRFARRQSGRWHH